MTSQEDIKKLGGFVSKVTVSADRKLWSDRTGSHGAALALEANVAADADIDTLTAALNAYVEAYLGRALGDTAEALREPVVSVAETAEEKPSDVEHVAIKKFKLTEEPGDKFVLLLFPDIDGKPGEWPELRYNANKESMWRMLRSVWDNDWKAPIEHEVDWVAEYTLGKEYTKTQGKNKGQKARYKDLRSIHKG